MLSTVAVIPGPQVSKLTSREYVCMRAHAYTHTASITQSKPLDSAGFLALLKTPGPR